jgi:RimJ/RimL family protein N-acetyltransferase
VEVTLETPRLRLRKFRESDWEPYAAMCADPDVMRYLGTGVTLSRDDAWRSIASILGHWQLRGYAIEAAREALRYAFDELRRDRVISLIRSANQRSINVAERLGSKLAGEVELLGSKALVYENRKSMG